ncbi:YodC family protein [Dyadobacter sp.]|uniref:YodC family protein n=1 Tax=Dyadobacter sp. TaxID=1914288 RepID=UPI003F719410
MVENKVGTTVQLKSGGPKMTVVNPATDVYGKDEVLCVYWNTNLFKYEKETFPKECLVFWAD